MNGVIGTTFHYIRFRHWFNHYLFQSNIRQCLPWNIKYRFPQYCVVIHCSSLYISIIEHVVSFNGDFKANVFSNHITGALKIDFKSTPHINANSLPRCNIKKQNNEIMQSVKELQTDVLKCRVLSNQWVHIYPWYLVFIKYDIVVYVCMHISCILQ